VMVAPHSYKSHSATLLSHAGSTFNRISSMLLRHNLNSADIPPRKTSEFLRPVKENRHVIRSTLG
jgi:hypothetical protein